MPRLTTPRHRRRRLRLAAALLGGLLALAAAELGLRAWIAIDHPAVVVLDDELGWRHAAGVARTFVNELGQPVHVRYDERGLRATPYPTERRPGIARVLVVGDSFVEGVMVDEPDIWTVKLDAALGDGVEVFNSGHSGWGTLQQLLWLEREGLSYRPDVVVHQVFRNDVWDNVTPFLEGAGARPYATFDGDELVIHALDRSAYEPFLMPFPFRTWFHRHCALYRSLHKNLFLPGAAERLRLVAEERRVDLPLESRQRVLLALLEQIRRRVAAAGAEWVLLVAPHVDEAARGAAATYGLVADWAREQGVDCHSLLDAVRPPAADAPPSYLPIDTHWTREGHARVAAAVEPLVRGALRRAGRGG